jgi:peptide/nickel transport system permease protein
MTVSMLFTPGSFFAAVVTLSFTLGLLSAPGTSRIVRGVALSVGQNDYVTAARAIGASDFRIMYRHVLPQLFAPLMVVSTSFLGATILAEASLSFLGLGPPPPTISWGGMLSIAGLASMQSAPWLAIFPGLAISLAVFGINMLGDALRDVLDPRLRTAA